jgi:dihydroorotate dehydrogenase
LISSGGITTPEEALNRIKSGANMVQLFTKVKLEVSLWSLDDC